MKALALVESPDHVCCRYRIQAFAPALRRAGIDLEIESLARGPIARALQLVRLPRFDTILLQRKLLPSWQLQAIRRRARHLVFDFDDAVLYRDSYDPRGPHCPRRVRRFTAAVQAADVVIAGNDFLADCAMRSGARPERVRVIPTCLDTKRSILANPPEPKPGLALVWIGSSSTLQGLEADKALWERLAKDVPGVRLRMIADRGADLGAMPVEAIPWRAETEAQELALSDVGISLVPDDLWSRGKCGLKILQYQAAALPVLANPVGVHAEMIESGVSGWLPRTPGEWVESVETLASDELLRFEMGRAGRAAVEKGYSIDVWEKTFVAALGGGVTTSPAGSAATPNQKSVRRGRVGRGPISTTRQGNEFSTNGAFHREADSDGACG